MKETVQKIFSKGKGVLALDWSSGTIAKHFTEVGLTSTPELNRVYRQMLVTTPNISEYVSGIILHDETVHQKLDDETPFAKYIASLGIVPGIRADMGSEKFEDTDQDITVGLEGLGDRIDDYLSLGIKFTKWRAGFKISDIYPSDAFIDESVAQLVKFAQISQEKNMVPFVEPDVEMKGNHTTTRCEEITTKVLKKLFSELEKAKVELENLILKTNMVLPGVDSGVAPAPLEVANATLRTFRNSAPSNIGGIVFLSGGQSYDDAVMNLDKIEDLATKDPWKISFSYARALQRDALKEWSGDEKKIPEAQKVLKFRLEKVSKARKGDL